MRRLLLTAGLALCLAGLSAGLLSLATANAQQGTQQHGPAGPSGGSAAARGRALFVESCASCHGLDARGRSRRGPTLRGVGAASIDFYVATGRMPLAKPGIEPMRTKPIITGPQRADLIAYLTGLAPGGPPIPTVHPEQGDLKRGTRLFADRCSGCHQIDGKGGIAPGLQAPSLDVATPTQIAEAIRVGPYLMPRFSDKTLPPADVDAIARYITTASRSPRDDGGWGIGNVGPIPEGAVAFLIAGFGLVLVARVIGERT